MRITNNLKYFSILLILNLIIPTSCGPKKEDNIERKLNIPIIESKQDHSTSLWSQMELRIDSLIHEIEASKVSERRALLHDYLSYHDRVDGSVAETYFYFAYDYPLKDTYDFFSCLEASDSVFTEKWAEIAQTELLFEIENEVDREELIKMIQNLSQTEKLHRVQDTLVKKYINHLLEKVE
jgi:hypothetical protein